MKLGKYIASLLLVAIFVVYQNSTNAATGENSEPQISSSNRALDVFVESDKNTYKPTDSINVRISLLNAAHKPIYIFDDLALGGSASFSIRVEDIESGSAVAQTRMFDALPPPPLSKDRFIKLKTGYLYGIQFIFRLQDLGIFKDGKYQLVAIYHSPIPVGYSYGLSTWTREMGEIASAPITISVEK